MSTRKIRFKKQIEGNRFEYIEQTSSSFLVPQDLMSVFNELCRGRTRSELLKFLLKRYRGFILLNQMQISRRAKTRFQKKGQNLQRISFKPDNRDWVELGILSTGLGCSRTLIFSIFLELELRGVGEFFDIPVLKKEVAYLEKYQANTIWRLYSNDEGFLRILWYLRP